MRSSVCAVAFFIFGSIFSSEVLIITHVCCRTDFLEIQVKTFKKFLKDDYEFVVFNDASDMNLHQQINLVCKNYGIQSVDVPQEIHVRPYLQRWSGENKNNPSVRHSNCIMYSLHTVGFKYDGIVLLLDSDMFLTKPFSVSAFMNGYDLAGTLRSNARGVDFLWPGLAFMDMRRMPNKETINWNCGRINNTSVDTGGHTYHYLRDNANICVRNFGCLHNHQLLCDMCKKTNNYLCTHNLKSLNNNNFDERTINFLRAGVPNIEFLCYNNFLHVRRGSWARERNKEFKCDLILKYMDEIINS